MATQNDSTAAGGFGRVSRTAGTVFRYLLLAATLFGLVVMTILLVYVANDAFQPLTADTGWHLTYLATLLAPALAVGAYLYRANVEALQTGALAVGLLVVSLLFSGGAALLLVDVVAPLELFAVAVAVLAPMAVVVAVVSRDRALSFTVQFATTTAAFYVSLFGLPGPIGSLLDLPLVVPSLVDVVLYAPYAPDPWLAVTLVVGGPVALAGSRFVAADRGRQTEATVAAAVLVGIALRALVGPLLGVDSMPATVVAAVGIAPPAVYAAGVGVNREHERLGLLLPAVVIAGTGVGVLATDALGFAGPDSWVTWAFLTSPHSRFAEQAGFYPAIAGSIMLMLAVAVLAFPVGVGAAVYLEEYAPENRFKRVVDVNISNLAGVPSVVYGLLGLGIFVTYLGRSAGTILVGGATLGLLILPIVIISAREAIRSVPRTSGTPPTAWARPAGRPSRTSCYRGRSRASSPEQFSRSAAPSGDRTAHHDRCTEREVRGAHSTRRGRQRDAPPGVRVVQPLRGRGVLPEGRAGRRRGAGRHPARDELRRHRPQKQVPDRRVSTQ